MRNLAKLNDYRFWERMPEMERLGKANPRAIHGSIMSKFIYKIISTSAWAEAKAKGRFDGATIDLQDGYIHLSSAEQAETTARLYFKEQNNLLLVAFRPDDFASTLKWEKSRGGALFPHIYGSIDPHSAVWEKPLPWRDGQHVFPEGWNT